LPHLVIFLGLIYRLTTSNHNRLDVVNVRLLQSKNNSATNLPAILRPEHPIRVVCGAIYRVLVKLPNWSLSLPEPVLPTILPPWPWLLVD